jgi:hypothetical protein
VSADRVPVADIEPDFLSAGIEAGHGVRAGQPYAELHGLYLAQVGEVAAADPVREPEVVLDPGTCRGLAADADAVQQHRRQPFRRAVDGRRQSGRPATDDREAGDVIRPLVGEADPLGESSRRGTRHRVAEHEHGRQIGRH